MFLVTKQQHVSSKSARGKRETRRLKAMAMGLDSLMSLDLMLDADQRLKDNPSMRTAVRDLLISLNPKLQEDVVLETPTT